MLGRRVDLERLRLDGPVVTERAAPMQPWLAGVMVGEQLGWTALRAAWQLAHISTVNTPSTSRNGPVEVPQKEQCAPDPKGRLIVRPPLFRPEWADEVGPSMGNESVGRTPT